MNYSLIAKDGTLLIPPSVIALNRAMTYSDQFSQAKSAESEILFADMENDAIDQLTRRLARRALDASGAGPGSAVGCAARAVTAAAAVSVVFRSLCSMCRTCSTSPIGSHATAT